MESFCSETAPVVVKWSQRGIVALGTAHVRVALICLCSCMTNFTVLTVPRKYTMPWRGTDCLVWVHRKRTLIEPIPMCFFKILSFLNIPVQSWGFRFLLSINLKVLTDNCCTWECCLKDTSSVLLILSQGGLCFARGFCTQVHDSVWIRLSSHSYSVGWRNHV